MEFENFMNPPIFDDLPEQIEAEVAKNKKYKDVIFGYDSENKIISVDVYWGKANYAVYSCDQNNFEIRKADTLEINKRINLFEDKESKRILTILEKNYMWIVEYFRRKIANDSCKQ